MKAGSMVKYVVSCLGYRRLRHSTQYRRKNNTGTVARKKRKEWHPPKSGSQSERSLECENWYIKNGYERIADNYYAITK